MVGYPGLTAQQQRNLPRLKKPASPIAAKFADSTHQLWLCDSVDGLLVLKVCRPDTIKHAAFWQGMNTLFAIDFPQALADIHLVYHQLAEWSVLPVPRCVAAQADSFVLASYLPGEPMTDQHILPQAVVLLAQQLSQLHQHSRANWGAFTQPLFTAEEWSLRLQTTLLQLAERQNIRLADPILVEALAQAARMTPKQFVPIMPDLRWDQFLSENGQISALVDVDAVVYGPRELEWVLLEYLLDAAQAKQFAQVYQQTQPLPDLTPVRMPYRLLLFLMNVLGEQDIKRWMQSPIRF